MIGVRCVLVDSSGLVVNYFLADPDNAAINSSEVDANGLLCISHDTAFPGDTLIDGVWAQSAQNASAD